MRKFITFVLIVLLSIKIAAILMRGPTEIRLDALGYWNLSNLVLEGDLLMRQDEIAYRTPMYPWFLAAIRAISPKPLLTIIAIQGWMALASIMIAGWIAARITKQSSALNWTMLAALPMCSSHVFAAATLTETLFVFLLMLHLLAVMDYAKHDSKGRLIWLAFTFGLTVLTRPIVLLLWLPHIVFVLWIHWRRRQRLGKSHSARVRLHHRFGHALLGAGVVVMMISPWLLRNYFLFDKPFLTEFVGRNLWIVSFRDGSGAGLPLPESQDSQELQQRLRAVGAEADWQDTWKVSAALSKSGLDDAEGDQLMRRVAWIAVQQDPQPFAWKALRRTVNFWRCTATDIWEQGNPENNYEQEFIWAYDIPVIDFAIKYRFSGSLIANTGLMIVMTLACLLLITQKTSRPYAIWLTLILGYFAVITGVLEIPDYRYRMVVEPIVALVIGSAATLMIQRYKIKKEEKAVG